MFEKFYEKYAPEEQEVIVLVRNCLGAGYNSGFWEMTAISLGMVFCDTGKVKIQEGRLKWPVTEKEKNKGKAWKKFNKGQICRIKVRKLLDDQAPAHMDPEKFNCWCVTRILKSKASCPQLEAVLEEYSRPVVIEDKILGTLTLNRELNIVETSLWWNKEEISLMLEIDSEKRSSWDAVFTAAKAIVMGQESWDTAMRAFAARELTELANDWLEDDDENQESAGITEESFSKRITLSELSIGSGGSFTAYYNDDDMFWGHAVQVCGSLEEGPTTADIVG